MQLIDSYTKEICGLPLATITSKDRRCYLTYNYLVGDLYVFGVGRGRFVLEVHLSRELLCGHRTQLQTLRPVAKALLVLFGVDL